MEKNGDSATIRGELEQLRGDAKYGVFEPLVEYGQSLIGSPKPENQSAAGAVVELVKRLQGFEETGGDVRSAIDRMAKGDFNQPFWTVEGNVYQASQITIVSDWLKRNAHQIKASKKIPIVPVVMTKDEADKLASLAVLPDPSVLHSAFCALQDILQKRDLGIWQDQYGPTPEAWRPFPNEPNVTLGSMVEGALSDLNKQPEQQNKSPLAADFKDIRALGSDRAALKELRTGGCIVIIDVLSMRHPALQVAYFNTMLDAFPRTSIVTFAPFADIFSVARELEVVIQLRLTDMEIGRRFSYKLKEYGECEEISEQDRLSNWFADRLRKLGGVEQASKASMRRAIRYGLR